MAVLNPVTLERIGVEARELKPLRTLLTVVAGLFWLLGWVAAKAFAAVWLVITWVVAAVKVGWLDCRAAGREDRS